MIPPYKKKILCMGNPFISPCISLTYIDLNVNQNQWPNWIGTIHNPHKNLKSYLIDFSWCRYILKKINWKCIVLGQLIKGYKLNHLFIYRAGIWILVSFDMKLSLPLLSLLMMALLSVLASINSRYILLKIKSDNGKPVTDGSGKFCLAKYIGNV